MAKNPKPLKSYLSEILENEQVNEAGQVWVDCTRCGGSGHYAFNPMHGTVCFGCNGRKGGWQSAERIAKRARARDSRRIKISERIRNRRMTKIVEACGFLDGRPDLRAALAGAPRKDLRRDLAQKLFQYGSLSEKQVAFAFRLVQQAAEKANEKKAPVPVVDGRVSIVGRVISTKMSDGAFPRLCMLVEILGGEGSYRLYGSVPNGIEVERDSVVTFDARVQRSDRDESFGFFSRPTNASVIGEAKA